MGKVGVGNASISKSTVRTQGAAMERGHSEIPHETAPLVSESHATHRACPLNACHRRDRSSRLGYCAW